MNAFLAPFPWNFYGSLIVSGFFFFDTFRAFPLNFAPPPMTEPHGKRRVPPFPLFSSPPTSRRMDPLSFRQFPTWMARVIAQAGVVNSPGFLHGFRNFFITIFGKSLYATPCPFLPSFLVFCDFF